MNPDKKIFPEISDLKPSGRQESKKRSSLKLPQLYDSKRPKLLDTKLPDNSVERDGWKAGSGSW
jgi:hypothetical protein